MKKQIKKVCCSLMVAFALIVSSFFGLTAGVISSINIALAKYESTVKHTYEFKESGTWSNYVPEVEASQKDTVKLAEKFKGTDAVVDLSTLEDSTYKPSKFHDGSSTAKDAEISKDIDKYVMMIKANNAPTTVVTYKKDENNKQVYKKNADETYVYEQENGADKIYEKNEGDANDYVKVTGGYKKKIKETETVNTYNYYKTINSITLNKNSWYVLTAYVWTKDAEASIAVQGTNLKAEYKDIATAGEWKFVELYIETLANTDTSDCYIYFYYGEKLNEELKTQGGLVDNTTANPTETGVVFLDSVNIRSISQTDYNNKTIDGQSKDQYAVQQSSRDPLLNSRLTETNFENFNVANDIYSTMYGENDYNKLLAESKDFQNFVIKYREALNPPSSSSNYTREQYEDFELSNLYELYKNENKFKVSTVDEASEDNLKLEEVVKDAEGKDKLDDDGKKVTEKVAVNTFNKDNTVLKIENNSRYNLGILSSPIQLDRYGYYRLSVYVKGVEETDKAYLTLVSYIKTATNASEGQVQLKSISIDAFTDNSPTTNNWKELVCYIRGSSLHNNLKFQFGLVAQENSTVYFDNIRLESVSSQAYENASSNQFDLAPSSTMISKGVTNGYFNYIKVEDPLKTLEAPYDPLNWTADKTKNDEKVVAGVIPTNNDLYNNIKSKLGNASNPIGLDQNGFNLPKTNVLAIHAPKFATDTDKTRTFTYKSDQFSFGRNSAYKITLKVLTSLSTTESTFEGNIIVKIATSKETLAEFKSSVTNGEWQTLTFLMRSDANDKYVTIELGVEGTGTAFFQEVGYEKLAEKTVKNDEGEDEKISVDTQYNELVKEYNDLRNSADNAKKEQAKYTIVADYAQNASAVHSAEKVKIPVENKVDEYVNKDYYQSLAYSLQTYDKDEKVEQGELGVIKTNENVKLTDTLTLTSAQTKNPNSQSDLAMLIYNSKELQTKVNPIASTELSSKSFYEISFYVKTLNVKDNAGLTVSIDKLAIPDQTDAKFFENINTQGDTFGDLTATNGYKKFTVLVRTGESSLSGLNIVFTLGTKDAKLEGIALISDIKVEQLKDLETYEGLVEAVSAEDKTTIVKNFFVEEKEDKDDQPVESLTLEIFFLVFSSLLLVVALVIAVVSVYIRKIPKQTTVVGTNNAEIKSASKKQQESETDSKDGFI